MSKYDHLVFYRQSITDIILLVVIVDNIVVTESASDYARISSLKSFLYIAYIHNLGKLKLFLGLEVNKSKKGICLFQRKYILDLLADFGKLVAEPCNTLMVPNMHVVKYPNQKRNG